MFTSFLYLNSPILLQELLLSLRYFARSTLREGRLFSDLLAQSEKSQWLSNSELTVYQTEKLRNVLNVARTRIPYYKEKWRDIEVALLYAHPETFLKQLPLLDKSQIRHAGRLLLAENAHKPIYKHHTSGTTGAPLTLYQDIFAITQEHAFVQRQLMWAGYRNGAKRAWFRGDMIVPTTAVTPPFWRRDWAGNMLMLSSYHLSHKNAPAYLDALARFDPVIIQAYPSSIGFVAAYLDSIGRDYSGSSLKGIVTSSETLSEKQRCTIEKRFGCRVFDWYGQNERVAAIGTCEQGNYHLMSDYSQVELIPAGEGLHEIVGTGYYNLVMPLIRYRTGDLVEFEKDATCSCGRVFPVIKRIHGRQSSFIKLRDGRCVASNCITMIFETGLDGILESQIQQDSLDELVVKVVPGSNYGDSLERQLILEASERLGHQLAVRVVRTDSIDRTGHGKLREVICNI